MPKPKSVQSAEEKETEEGKQFLAEKLDNLKERNAVIKHQLDRMKADKLERTANANAYWAGANIWLIYEELQTLYGTIGQIVEELEKLDSRTSKLSGEWQKKKEILNRFKMAMDFTDEMLLGNK